MKTLKHLLVLSMSMLLIAGCSSKKDGSSDSSSSDNSENNRITEVNSELLRTVDFNSAIVAVANFEQLKATYQSEEWSEINDYDEFADLSSVVIVKPGRHADKYTTFSIDNQDAFTTYATQNLTQLTDRGDFAVYQPKYKDGFIMVKGSQMWIGDNPAAIESSVKNAATKHFGEGLAISASIEQPHTINVAVNMAIIPDVAKYNEELSNAWGIANIDMTKYTVTGDAKIVTGNGDAVQFPGMQPINTSFLKYTDGEPNMALALGISKDFPWKTLQKILGDTGVDSSTLSYMTLIGRMINGTVGVSASVDPDNGEISFSALIESSNADPEALMGMLEGVVGQLPTTPDGFYTIPIEQLPTGNVFIGAVEEKFYVGSHHPSQFNGNNSLQSVFSGNEAVFSINLPKSLVSLFSEGELSCGVKGIAQVKNSTAHFEISVTDTNLSIIEVLSKL